MKTISLFIILIAALASPWCVAQLNNAQIQGGISYQLQANKQNLKVKSSEQAAKIVKNRYGGKVLSAKFKQQNQQAGYRVKLLKTDGHIIYVYVNAHTGKIKG